VINQLVDSIDYPGLLDLTCHLYDMLHCCHVL